MVARAGACSHIPDVPELTHDEGQVPRRHGLPPDHRLLRAVDVGVARKGRGVAVHTLGLHINAVGTKDTVVSLTAYAAKRCASRSSAKGVAQCGVESP